MSDTPIPINALFDESGVRPNPSGVDYRPMLHQAEVIFGVDHMSGRQFLVYGRALLESIVESGVTRSLYTLRIGIDQETKELEQLLALMQVIKGKHDYVGSDPKNPDHPCKH